MATRGKKVLTINRLVQDFLPESRTSVQSSPGQAAATITLKLLHSGNFALLQESIGPVSKRHNCIAWHVTKNDKWQHVLCITWCNNQLLWAYCIYIYIYIYMHRSKNSLLLCSLKVYYSVHKRPPMEPILTQLNPTHNLEHYLRLILLLLPHLNIGLPSYLFPRWYLIKILYVFLIPQCMLYTPPILCSFI
jgi:hypothetical protein